MTISIWFSDQCLDWTKRQKWIFSDKDRRSTNERNFSFDDDAAAVSTRRLFQWKENDRIECSKSMFHFLIVKLNSSKNQTIVILAQNKESLGSVTFFTKKTSRTPLVPTSFVYLFQHESFILWFEVEICDFVNNRVYKSIVSSDINSRIT